MTTRGGGSSSEAAPAWGRWGAGFPLFRPVRPGPSAVSDRGWALAAAGLAALVTARRTPGIFDRLWAEDGVQFYAAARQLGPVGSLGQWYAGYLHTVARLIADAALLVPVRWAPVAFGLGVLLVIGAGAALVEVVSGAHLRSRAVRVVLGASVGYLAVLGEEAIGNAANLQFFLAFFGFWLLLWMPRHRAGDVGAAVALTLVALSTPLAAFLVPLAVVRLVVVRPPARRWPPVAFLVATTVHVALRAAAHVGRDVAADGRTGGFEVARWSLRSVAGNLSPGYGATTPRPWAVAGVVVVLVPLLALLGLLVHQARRTAAAAWGEPSPDGRSGRRRAQLALVIAATLTALLAGPPMVLLATDSPRYATFPGLLLVTVVAVAVDVAVDPDQVRPWPALCALVVVGGLAAASWVGFGPSDLRSTGVSWSGAVDTARLRCAGSPGQAVVPIQSSPPYLRLAVRCDDLR